MRDHVDGKRGVDQRQHLIPMPLAAKNRLGPQRTGQEPLDQQAAFRNETAGRSSQISPREFTVDGHSIVVEILDYDMRHTD